MADFAQILQHEHQERRKSQLGVSLLMMTILFVLITLASYIGA